jgi:hypothetical protein
LTRQPPLVDPIVLITSLEGPLPPSLNTRAQSPSIVPQIT